jgi:hypothetical protein
MGTSLGTVSSQVSFPVVALRIDTIPNTTDDKAKIKAKL